MQRNQSDNNIDSQTIDLCDNNEAMMLSLAHCQCHTSTFMTQENPNSINREVITDLSWSMDVSVNVGIDKDSFLGTEFALILWKINDVTDQITHIFKVDISHLKINPKDLDLLRLY